MISNNIKKIKAAITAVGGYTPDDFISNKDLEKMVDTNDEWITARTGIKKRRILKEKGKATSYLAINAANNLIKKKKLSSKAYSDENKQKIVSMLYRKGFSYDDINRVLVEKKFT